MTEQEKQIIESLFEIADPGPVKKSLWATYQKLLTKQEPSEPGPDASVWATSTDLKGSEHERKVYFVLIRDGERTLNVALTTRPTLNEVKADVYQTPDYDYTIHDGCDHEYGCVLDDPDFEENWYGPQPGVIYQDVRKGTHERDHYQS